MAQIIAGGTKPDSGGNVEVITQTQTTTWTQLQGKPYISVSSKGIVNGLSNIPNDGADFGPDTTKGATAPGQYGAPYTETSGIQEIVSYAVAQGGGRIWFADGVYDTTNAPLQQYTGVNGTTYAKILVGNGNSFNSAHIQIVMRLGSAPSQQNQSSTALITTYGVTLIDNTAGNSTQTAFIMGVPGNSGVPSNLELDIDRCNILVKAGNGIGGLDFTNAMKLTADTLNFGVNQQWNLPEPTVTTQVALALNGGNTEGGTINYVWISGGYYFGIVLGQGNVINHLTISACLFPIRVEDLLNDVFIGVLELLDNPYSVSITNTSGLLRIGVLMLALATTDQFAAWQNVQTFGNISASAQLLIDIDIFYYYTGPNLSAYIGSYVNTTININRIYVPTTTWTQSIPTLSTNPPVSGTAYQNTNPYDIEIDLPVYATTSGTAGYVTVAKGASSTPTAIGNQYVSGDTSSTSVDIIRLRVPANWYYEFTASGVTFGTASVFAE